MLTSALASLERELARSTYAPRRRLALEAKRISWRVGSWQDFVELATSMLEDTP